MKIYKNILLKSLLFCSVITLSALTVMNLTSCDGNNNVNDADTLSADGKDWSGRTAGTIHCLKGSDYAKIESYSEDFKAQNLIIPAKVKFPDGEVLPLKVIDDSAFNQAINLKGSLTLPKYLLKIGRGAFYNCSNLNETLTIPGSVGDIGDGAFSNTKFKNLNLSSPAKFKLASKKSVGDAKILLPMNHDGNDFDYENDKVVGGLAIGDLEIPKGTVSIKEGLFENCNLTSVLIPNSVTDIKNNAFKNCSNLKKIILDGYSSVNWSGTNIFANVATQGKIHSVNGNFPITAALLNNLGIGDWSNVNLIGNADGKNWGGYISGNITVEKNSSDETCAIVSTNGYHAKNLVLPEIIRFDNDNKDYKLTRINDNAFKNMPMSGSILISKNITTIGSNAFANVRLNNIFNESSAFKFADSSNVGNAEVLILSTDTFNFSTTKPVGCLAIGELSVNNHENFTIENDFFTNCAGLNGTLTLNSNLTEIKAKAFKNCIGIKTICFQKPHSALSIAADAFSGCDNINKLFFDGSTSSQEALNNIVSHFVTNGTIISINSNIAGVEIANAINTANAGYHWIASEPENTKSEAGGDLYGIIHGNVIYADAENNKKKISTVSADFQADGLFLPDYIKTTDGKIWELIKIEQNAFADLHNKLSGTLTLNKKLTAIGNCAFKNSDLMGVNINGNKNFCFANEESVGKAKVLMHFQDTNTFDYQSGVVAGSLAFGELTIPVNDGVFNINAHAFEGCNNLIGNLFIPKKIVTIGENAFADCAGLNKRLTFNGQLTIGNAAFKNCTHINQIVFDQLSGEHLSDAESNGIFENVGINNPLDSNKLFFINSRDTVNSDNFYNNLFSEAKCKLSNRYWATLVFRTGYIGNEHGTNLEGYLEGQLQIIKIDNHAKLITGVANKYKATNLILPDDVLFDDGKILPLTEIDNNAFLNSNLLSGEIDFGSNMQNIGSQAFSGCGNLNKIIIHEKITNFGAGALNNCHNVDNITFIGFRARPAFICSTDLFSGLKTSGTVTVASLKLDGTENEEWSSNNAQSFCNEKGLS